MAIRSKAEATSANRERAFFRRVCGHSSQSPTSPAQFSQADLSDHSLPRHSRKGSRLPLSCRSPPPPPLPAACTMAPHTCRLRGSLTKGLAAKERASSLWSNTKTSRQLIHCKTERVWTECVCVWVSGWKFAHHSLKANSVQVLGAVVPQHVRSAVGTGSAPVLDLGHLQSR